MQTCLQWWPVQPLYFLLSLKMSHCFRPLCCHNTAVFQWWSVWKCCIVSFWKLTWKMFIHLFEPSQNAFKDNTETVVELYKRPGLWLILINRKKLCGFNKRRIYVLFCFLLTNVCMCDVTALSSSVHQAKSVRKFSWITSPLFFSLIYECKTWMFAILTNCLLQKMPKNSNHNFKAIVNIKRE